MRLYLFFFLFLFLTCQSQIASNKVMSPRKEIQFEDKNHYPFTLIRKDFLLINSQQKMDEIFTIIHRKNVGNRFSPIPSITEDETYIIVKPSLKNSNDVSIEAITFDKNTLYIKVKEFNNPDFNEKSRIPPDILLKLNENLSVKKVNIQY
ncbi:MAG TPA: hypothetical protein DCQ50_16315 [Chryseobacterium sp.]|nr:hypothetical protein [Chryseobacterium sp.]